MSEIPVKPQYMEEEVNQVVEEVVKDERIDKQLEALRKQRDELLKKLQDINVKITELFSRKIKRKVVKRKVRVALIVCPRCGARIKLVVKDVFTGRVRCRCGAILRSV